MKIIFLSTPEFGVPSLQALIDNNYEVLAVVTQPDRKGNRGEISISPVKKLAIEKGIKVLQFESISKEGESIIKALHPDVMITCAFGQMLKQNILDIAPIYNVHPSLLPKYRGATPIQWSLINGEKETGVTIMKTELGMDCGDILWSEKTPIIPNETLGDLFIRLAHMGARGLITALKQLESGNFKLIKQNESEATSFKTLKKEDGLLNFNEDSRVVYNRYRGVTPWPGAHAFLEGKIIKFIKLSLPTNTDIENFLSMSNIYNLQPGLVVANKREIFICCKNKFFIKVDILQLEGNKKLEAKDFLNGNNINGKILKGSEK